MMSGNIKINPQKLITGVPSLDSISVEEFTFHHGHVEKVINSMDDLLAAGFKVDKTFSNASQIIFIKSTFEGTLQSGELKNAIPCQPLLRGFSDSIARGDSVIYTTIGGVNYYLGPLNTTNNPNYTPDTYYNPNLNTKKKSKIIVDDRKDDLNGYNANFKKTNVRKVFKQKIYELDAPYETGIGEKGSDAELESVYSDLSLEGRHNNSIQIGSRFVNPYITIKNNNVDNNGSIIGLLSLGSIGQFFNGYKSLSIDKRIAKERETLTEGQYPGYRINFGNDEIGEPRQDVFNIEYGKLQDNPEHQTEFDQIIMFSDRITFDAQENDLTMSAYRNINFGAGRNITITNKGFSVIESENIYLGKKAKNKSEPIVLGEQLRVLLEQVINILSNAHALVQGVPLPLVDVLGAPLNIAKGELVGGAKKSLTEIIQSLEQRQQDDNGVYQDGVTPFLSKHHYIEQNDRSQNNEG